MITDPLEEKCNALEALSALSVATQTGEAKVVLAYIDTQAAEIVRLNTKLTEAVAGRDQEVAAMDALSNWLVGQGLVDYDQIDGITNRARNKVADAEHAARTTKLQKDRDQRPDESPDES